MLNYPVILTLDTNGSYLVGFPDFPATNSVGFNEQEAKDNAIEQLKIAIMVCFVNKRYAPLPSKPRANQQLVNLPTSASLKLLLWNEMLTRGMRKIDLSRMLNVNSLQIDNLFNLKHNSKIEFLENAAKILGKKLKISLV